MTLSNLGVLYRDTQRMGEAEAALDESHTLLTKLYETNPAVHARDFVRVNLLLGIVKLKRGKPSEACALAKRVRALGLQSFPGEAAELDRACPAP